MLWDHPVQALRALPAEQSIPNSSLEKGRKVVSSLRFLLKSMHSTLSFFLIALIFFKKNQKNQREVRARSCPHPAELPSTEPGPGSGPAQRCRIN